MAASPIQRSSKKNEIESLLKHNSFGHSDESSDEIANSS